jgi:hypothetical protein
MRTHCKKQKQKRKQNKTKIQRLNSEKEKISLLPILGWGRLGEREQGRGIHSTISLSSFPLPL